jgi:hypothetical protein
VNQWIWSYKNICQWIGLRENLQESPIFNGKIYGFPSTSRYIYIYHLVI